MLSKLYQLIKILDYKDQVSLIILFVMTLIAMSLEVFSIIAVLPLIQEFLSSENNFEFLSNIKYFENYDLTNVLIFLFIFIHFFKFLYLFFFYYIQSSFINNLSAKLTTRLFSNYLIQDYELHTQKKTSVMLRNLISETKMLCSTFINPIFILIIETVIITGVVIFLFVYQSKLSLMIGITFIILIILYMMIVKKKFFNWGLARQSLNNNSLKISLDGLTGIKDLMIYHKENFFREKFTKNEFEFAKVSKLYSTFQQLPRLVFEFIIIFFLILLVYFLKKDNLPNNNIIEIIGVFAVASVRFIPGASKIIGSFQQIRFGAPSLNTILNENIFKKKYYDDYLYKRELNSIYKFNDHIELKNISFTYKNKKENIILENLNLRINKNEIIGILGPSGSGKSTIVDILSGLLFPTSGNIYLDGKNIDQNILIRGLFAYVPQNVYLLNDTIKNNIIFDSASHDVNEEKLENSVKFSQLDGFLDSLPNKINTFVGERGSMLSGGQVQRIGIARALYHQSEIIIFDESTNALDQKSEMKVIEEIKNLKKIKTIIIISHKELNLEICDRIYELKDKKLEIKKL